MVNLYPSMITRVKHLDVLIAVILCLAIAYMLKKMNLSLVTPQSTPSLSPIMPYQTTHPSTKYLDLRLLGPVNALFEVAAVFGTHVVSKQQAFGNLGSAAVHPVSRFAISEQ